jgi:hypothetical protein
MPQISPHVPQNVSSPLIPPHPSAPHLALNWSYKRDELVDREENDCIFLSPLKLTSMLVHPPRRDLVQNERLGVGYYKW